MWTIVFLSSRAPHKRMFLIRVTGDHAHVGAIGRFLLLIFHG